MNRLSIVTLGTRDLATSRSFYVDGLGWEPTFEVAGEVCFIQIAHGVLLALWRVEELAKDSGHPVTVGPIGRSGRPTKVGQIGSGPSRSRGSAYPSHCVAGSARASG